MQHETEFRIEHSHPALPGHFPGRPVVPGVVVLERALEAAERWLGREMRIRGVPQLKFLAPLLPGETARVRLALAGTALRIEVESGGRAVAQGQCTLDEAAA